MTIALFCLLAPASCRLVGLRCFVASGLFRAVALRRLHSGPPGFLLRCPCSTHHLDALAALRLNALLLAGASRFLALGRVVEKPSRRGVSKHPASRLLNALRCHGTVGVWLSDAGFL